MSAKLFGPVLACAALVCAAGPALEAQAPTPVPVLTWRYDLTHAGQNTNETALTPQNVNPSTFGKLFSLSVDSTTYSQPLYVPGLTMSDGLVHNVLFVSTSNDTVYAFDADSNGGANSKPIWQISLLSTAHGAGAGATAVPWGDTGSPDVAPTIGITGTGTINTATNTLYLVANTKESGAYFSRLHAINIITGAEQPNSPVNITATVNGTGNGSSGGKLSFSPLWQNQRTALNYYNGYVYFGYAAHGDNGPWHGWLFAYNATTLQQSAALCLSPNGYGAGIWGAGAGMPIDDDGNGGRMFVVTGNGTPTTNYPPFNANTEYGESVVDFSLANGGITPTDEFTAYNADYLNDHDYDLGSGGILMVPDQEGPTPHVLIQSGKEGRITVLNRDALGGYAAGASSNTNALQDITGDLPVGDGLWSTPAYWNGYVYLWGNQNVPMLFQMTNGVLSTKPISQAPTTLFKSSLIFPEPSFTVSSNGTQDGIAWAVLSDLFNTDGPAVLYAWPATNLTTPLYESDTNSTRDSAGPANKFAIPIVTNGKVYVATHGQVDVYGLFNGQQSAAAPVITPNGGTFGASESVTLSSTTTNAQIYYTLDGSTPTPASTLYAGAITISTDTTLKAIASAAGYVQSSISSAVFNFSDQTPLISFSPAAGTYTNTQTVTLSDTDANARIYYTLDGSTPSSSSNLYTGPIKVAVSETINAIAIDSSLSNSDIGTAAYVIQAGGTTINFGGGFASTTGLTLNGSTLATNDTRMQLTDGGLNEAGSVFWNTPINIQAFTTDFEFQLSLAQGNGFTFTVQNVAPTALGGNSAGLGYQGIGKSVAIKFNFYNYDNEGSDSTGFYTDGEAPVLPTIDLTSSGIELNSDDSITAHVTYDGTTLTLTLHDLVTNDTFTTSQAINIPQVVGGTTAYVGFTGGSGGLSSSQKILTWTYSTQSVAPAFAPGAGSYAAAQNVAMTSATSDAQIFYTTDGTTPTAASTQYSGPIAVTASATVNAIAISPTLGGSNVTSAAYVIQRPTPTFAVSAASAPAVTQGASTTSTITVTPSGGFTGSVALTCVVTGPSGAVDLPTCPAQTATVTGATPVTASLTIDTQAATTPGTYTVTVSGAAGGATETATVNLAVNAVSTLPAFALSGTAVSITGPGQTGTSTVTIKPSGGFTGTIAVACKVTSAPAGAVDPPTCTATQPSAITGSASVTSTVTVSTTAASTTTSALHKPGQQLFTLGGGGTLVALLIFCMPLRRKKWQALLSLLILMVVASAAIGCGGNSITTTPVSGTTPGNYVITVTGTSGSTAINAKIAVTVAP